MIENYVLNVDFEELALRGYVPVGKSGLLLSKKSIGQEEVIKKDLTKVLIDANKTKGKNMKYAVVFSTENNILKNEYTYIVQGLKKKIL